ncbi:MAG: MATE family efflux transporter [Spirochaetales bacterium]|nr:MATE family efflux transporter [Spirochaetales bacterium]
MAMSLVSILYNFQLIKIAGEDGIASFGALMYVSYIFVSLFLGYGIGSAPIISYHYGAENTSELKNLFKKDIAIISISGIAIFVLSEVLTIPLAKIFASYDETLFQMIKRAFRLYSFAYLLCGFNIIGSSFFTALNNGIVSAVISFLRTLVFEVAAIFILPIFLKLDGIWLSGVAAEVFSFTVTLICILALRKKYGYF